MADALELHQGEEKIFTVAIDEDGVPLDLTGFTLSTEIWWRGKKRLTLALGSGLEVLDLSPPTPGSGEDMPPQYQFRLSEAQSAMLPEGRIAQAFQVRVSPSVVTTRRGPVYFKVLAP